MTQIKFLRYEVTAEGTKPSPEKIEAIKNFPRPTTVKQLRQFLEMIIFYRRFIPGVVPGAAQHQATLNDALKGPKTKDKMPIIWTVQLKEAFSKESLARAMKLAHPDVAAELRLVTDALDITIGAALQQRAQEDWQPLAFLSKKLSNAQTKYSPYDRELLAIYTVVRHFWRILEGRQFTILTDHKPLIYAFMQDPLKSSPRQMRHLEFIGQFTIDIRHTRNENVVADDLSRVDNIQKSIDYGELTKE